MKDMIKVDRRDFFKFAAAAGVGIPSWSLMSDASAQTSQVYTGKVLINILADGGIAHGFWTDPRNGDATINSWVTRVNTAPQVGNLRMAPVGNNAAFLTAFQPHMMFINGCNMETNDHDAGKRVSATGSLGMGFASISELHANQHGKGLPMPWLNSANMNVATSAGLVAPTPTPSANTLRALAQPNAVNATNDLMKQGDLDKGLAARAARMQAAQASGTQVPRLNVLSKQFVDSDQSRALLGRVAGFIPAAFNNNFQQAHAAMVAVQAGITSTVQLNTGGFDTHGNADQGLNGGTMARLTDMVQFIFDTAAAMSIENRIVVRIHSDFGRTVMNNGNGNDHLGAGGTCVLIERNAPWANRVVGATGPRFQVMRINPMTGAIDNTNGVVIRPRHIMVALREYLGINVTDPRFNLNVPANERINFFGAGVNTGYPNP